MVQTGHRNIVIIGGGIIGCTTAYYISRHPSYSPSTTSITVLEASAHGIAQGASGKAGGLVAKWAYPRELVDISFPEHVKLAKEHNGKERWGWRFVGCGNWEGRGEDLSSEIGSGVGKGGKRKSLEKKLGLDHEPEPGLQSGSSSRRAQTGHPDDLNWVKEHLTDSYSSMSAPDGTAQVHPYLFTTSMMDLAAEKGATLLRGSATSIEREGGQVTGVRYMDPIDNSSKVLPATHVILSAGAWSPSIIPSLPISATRAHSVIVRPRPDVTIAPYVIFTEITLPRGQIVTPEIYARPDNEIYACGPGDDSRLPGNVDDVAVDETACQSIWEHVASISTKFKEGTIEKRQACCLPIVSVGGEPIIGEARKIARGVYIATGHTCWGICNAPGTGKVIAELILNGKMYSRNLKELAPSRFL
ncbi:D-amino-acid dehydrogenase [Paxillus involutus ATCC 200175]|nr:D-amino-acid dehydrogenase [Paxillus involutus ATCC 200175]